MLDFKNHLFPLCSGILLFYSNFAIAAQVDQSRMLDIAQYVIKMQTLNDSHAAEHIKVMAELIVDSKKPQDTALILDSIPPQGIAQHLRQLNTQGLKDNIAQQMLNVINIEIDQTSQMFNSCKVLGTAQKKANDLYAIKIECQVPNPSPLAIRNYQQQMAKINPNTHAQYRINHFKISQQILNQSDTRPFISELMIDTSQPPIYRPIIEDDSYFPNVVIDQRTDLFILKKAAATH